MGPRVQWNQASDTRRYSMAALLSSSPVMYSVKDARPRKKAEKCPNTVGRSMPTTAEEARNKCVAETEDLRKLRNAQAAECLHTGTDSGH